MKLWLTLRPPYSTYPCLLCNSALQALSYGKILSRIRPLTLMFANMPPPLGFGPSAFHQTCETLNRGFLLPLYAAQAIPHLPLLLRCSYGFLRLCRHHCKQTCRLFTSLSSHSSISLSSFTCSTSSNFSFTLMRHSNGALAYAKPCRKRCLKALTGGATVAADADRGCRFLLFELSLC